VISYEGDSIPWAAAGQTVTLYMTAVDPIHLNVGSILCPSTSIVPLATTFTARVIVFDIAMPITAGTSVRKNSTDIDDHLLSLIFYLGRVVPPLARHTRIRFEASVDGRPFDGENGQAIPESADERRFGRSTNRSSLRKGNRQGIPYAPRDICNKQRDGENFD